jgi:hypothetical protein
MADDFVSRALPPLPQTSLAVDGAVFVQVLRVAVEDGHLGLAAAMRVCAACREFRAALSACSAVWRSLCARIAGLDAVSLVEHTCPGASTSPLGSIDLLFALADPHSPQTALFDLLEIDPGKDRNDLFRVLLGVTGLPRANVLRWAIGSAYEDHGGASAPVPSTVAEYCSSIDMRDVALREAMRRVVTRLQPAAEVDGWFVARGVFQAYAKQNPDRLASLDPKALALAKSNPLQFIRQWASFGITGEQLVLSPDPTPAMIGELCGHSNATPLLEAFFSSFSFAGCPITAAIGMFASRCQLPGETQLIDRLLLVMAKTFFADNPGILPNAEAAYILAYSALLLAIDLHRPQASSSARMSLESFLAVNRGTNIPEPILCEVFRWTIEAKPPN